mmetsp:Transcript_20253/g.46444  ORF Transcript_20253/g.46444 Transcript_20253/m.46444 type:complete len:82 (-) Transcript_20253:666-911(-)
MHSSSTHRPSYKQRATTQSMSDLGSTGSNGLTPNSAEQPRRNARSWAEHADISAEIASLTSSGLEELLDVWLSIELTKRQH